jgi:hypothetical protein
MRRLTYTFTIPFDGGAADTCEAMIRGRITGAVLNSLSTIHEDIRATVRVQSFPESDQIIALPADRVPEGGERIWIGEGVAKRFGDMTARDLRRAMSYAGLRMARGYGEEVEPR